MGSRPRTPTVVRIGGPALLCALAAAAGADDAVPLFADDTVLAVRLEAPLTTLKRERSDTEYLDGVLQYPDADGQHSLDVKLRARGRYRRRDDTCSFPPVRLNLRKKQVEHTPFDGVDKVKLVTHCGGSGRDEQNVLEEYLAYRILNDLTDASFRVRLLRVEYVDTEKDGEPLARYAFLIEDDDLLAERIGSSRVELRTTAVSRLVAEQASLVAVFEYLVGNTDFSMIAGAKDDICCHNIVLYDAAGGRLLPVPYDFDFSGLVNARYATPNPRLKIRRVTNRLYRGYCAHNAQVAGAVESVVAREAEIMGLVEAIPGMDDGTRSRARRYLGAFFRDMAGDDAVERKFVKECS